MIVATYNVRHCLGLDRRIDVERVAHVVRRTGADVVALQELDRNLPRSRRVDQPAAIGAGAGLHVAFGATVRRRGGEYGIGLGARAPLEARVELLPGRAGVEPRAAIVATVDGLRVVATHLSLDVDVRRAQIARLAELASGPGPAVVVGDLNAPRRELRALVDAGFDPGPRRLTFGRVQRRQIDYVAAGPGVRHVRVWTLRSDASDHLPLVAELELA